MQEQVSYLRKSGISSVSLSKINDEEAKEVELGNFSVVYTTPEALIKNERWRKNTIEKRLYLKVVCYCSGRGSCH